MQFLKLPDVSAKVGLKKTEIYRRIKAGEFPKPLHLGARASVWVDEHVEAWMLQQIERHSGQPGKRGLT